MKTRNLPFLLSVVFFAIPAWKLLLDDRMLDGAVAFADDTNRFALVESELNARLQQQTQAWNRGDIAAFMEPYWKDERLTFSSGGQTTRGWERTYQRYKSKYPDMATMGKLAFSNLESQALGSDAVLMLGVWHLERDKPIGGNFSLVWKRIDGKWLIVHDHSSAMNASP